MVIIPARLESSRLARKVLCDIGGLPMVVRTALQASKIDEVVVACDDSEIMDICKRYKIACVMTDKTHTSGTDRCAQAANKLGLNDEEIVINLQADEPFIETEVLESLRDLSAVSNAFINTLAKVIAPNEISDVNLVKVLLNINNEAIYFSRLGIPYSRDGLDSQLIRENPYLGHLGLYGFRKANLDEFCSLKKSPLEHIEKLEQLRALYHNKTIAIKVVETKSVGIDTMDDLQKAREAFVQFGL